MKRYSLGLCRKSLFFVFILLICGCLKIPNSDSVATNDSYRYEISISTKILPLSFAIFFDSAVVKAEDSQKKKVGEENCIVLNPEISCNITLYEGEARYYEFYSYTLSDLTYSGVQKYAGKHMVQSIIPHKVNSSLSLSDILDPVPPSQPHTWTWTGDASGGGSQASVHYSGDTLILDSTAHVHFTARDSSFGNVNHVFRFKARALDFGWRIPDSSSGKSLHLAYDPVGSPNQIKLIRGNWESQSVDFADSLEYMYEPDLWHVVQIVDSSGTLGIYFDGIKLDFFRTRASSQYLSGLGSGGIGIGTRNSGMKVSGLMGLR